MIDFRVIAAAFVTGLTTGGLSCMAVQGGLLTGSIARQVEQGLSASRTERGRQQAAAPAMPGRVARATLVFLSAKLAAYTALGMLLGALGTLLQLTPTLRAVFLFAVGIFLLGNGLRMLNVHPFFRVFALEPPKAITRYIRHTARNAGMVTPLLLGALTVLIPCGVTQAMMAVAMSTGNAWAGAAIMAAFTLGSSPTFFALIYLASQLGARWQRRFAQVVAAALLVLGLVTIDGGLSLLGAPSVAGLVRSVRGGSPSAAADPEATQAAAGGPDQGAANALTLSVTDGGYVPDVLQAQAGAPITLSLVTDHTRGCARAFVIPALNEQRLLPETGTVVLTLPAQPAGAVVHFTCSMGMYTGVIEVN